MADGKIFITISSSSGGSGVSADQQESTNGELAETNVGTAKPKKAGKTNSTQKILGALLVSEGKKVLSNAISQYENLTGDGVTASRLQAISTIGAYALAIKAGGWVGAVGVAVDVGLSAFNSYVETKKANQQLDLLKERVGLSAINGSRETYD